MNKVKIIASITPSNYKDNLVEEMILSGVDVIQLDVSVNSKDFCKKIIGEIKEANDKLKKLTSIMLNIEGFIIKTLEFTNNKAYFKTGDKIRLYTKKTIGNNYQFSTNYSNIINEVNMHSILKLNNGEVILEVQGKGLDYLILKVINGGYVQDFTKIYIPNISLNKKYLTPQDIENIKFANKMEIQYLSLSNINSHLDILEVHDLLIKLENDNINIITKIQNNLAIDDIDKIIKISDGIIISRKELEIDIPAEQIPLAKNKIISKCLKESKPSIICAEINHTNATLNRSEVSDLSSNVLEGIDGVMINDSINHTQIITQIIKILSTSLENIDHKNHINPTSPKKTTKIVGNCANLAALQLNAKAIVVFTNSGHTAKLISSLRPPCYVIALCLNPKIAESLKLNFALIPVIIDKENINELQKNVITTVSQILNLKKGDKIIVTGSYPIDKVTYTNFMKIEEM